MSGKIDARACRDTCLLADGGGWLAGGLAVTETVARLGEGGLHRPAA
ncbi:hypothetical protein [Maritimibacter dapengensis]|uniref:Uncharacterized protein n=1 Tax=Maritimibacter dapengensis TaxID=2836868 RepID=A0ABS6SYV7_9RHOB|nr:hypothetical protein [Maritimibacter dapengensis]MBV7378163.1 hypothetical protein [Maritimibacter dapengensis]